MGRSMTGPALSILARCRRLGIVLAVQGDRLRYKPVEAVDGELRDALKFHKATILAALAAAGTGGMAVGDILNRRDMQEGKRGGIFGQAALAPVGHDQT